MSLIVCDQQVLAEATRVIGSKNALEVLNLTAASLSEESILRQHDRLMTLFKGALRDPQVAKAGEIVKKAKLQLLDSKLRSQELQKLGSQNSALLDERRAIEDQWKKTRDLEEKAAAVLNSRMSCATGDGPVVS